MAPQTTAENPILDEEIEKSNIDPNLNSLFYNGKAIETEVECKLTGSFPKWVSGNRFSAIEDGNVDFRCYVPKRAGEI